MVIPPRLGRIDFIFVYHSRSSILTNTRQQFTARRRQQHFCADFSAHDDAARLFFRDFADNGCILRIFSLLQDGDDIAGDFLRGNDDQTAFAGQV